MNLPGDRREASSSHARPATVLLRAGLAVPAVISSTRRNWQAADAFPVCPYIQTGCAMKFLTWLGVAMVIAWAILWLGVKLAMGAVHVLLVLGVVAIAWGLIKGASASR